MKIIYGSFFIVFFTLLISFSKFGLQTYLNTFNTVSYSNTPIALNATGVNADNGEIIYLDNTSVASSAGDSDDESTGNASSEYTLDASTDQLRSGITFSNVECDADSRGFVQTATNIRYFSNVANAQGSPSNTFAENPTSYPGGSSILLLRFPKVLPVRSKVIVFLGVNPAINSSDIQVQRSTASGGNNGFLADANNTTSGNVREVSFEVTGNPLEYMRIEAYQTGARVYGATFDTCFLDFDNDGIEDSNDLDDDNDGIPDINENDCSAGPVPINSGSYIFNQDYSTASPLANMAAYGTTNVDISYTLLGSATWGSGVRIYNNGAIAPDGEHINLQPQNTDFYNGDVGEYTLDFNKEVVNLSFKWGGLDLGDVVQFKGYKNGLEVPINNDNITNINIPAADFSYVGQNTVESESSGSNAPNNSVLFSYQGSLDRVVITVGKNTDNALSSTTQLYEISYCETRDTDGDGVFDYFDLDSDNDGIYDVVEAGHGQTHNAGVLNTFIGPNGLANSVETSAESGTINYTIRNSDATTFPDFQDTDSDNDGCSDANEAYTDANADDGDNTYYATGNPPPVDDDGRVSAATYPVPADNDNNATFDYQEAGTAPVITTDPADRNTCSGDTTSFTVVASNANTYQWQLFNGTSFIDVTNAGIHNGTTTATITINSAQLSDSGNQYRVVVSNSAYICGNEVSETATLTVAQPKVDAGPDRVICDGQSITLTANASDGAPLYAYSWNTGQSTASIQVTPNGNPNANTTINYIVSIEDQNGCVATDTVQVTVLSKPTATVTKQDPSCNLDNGSITFTFPDHPNRSGIEFSLDNQATYETEILDNTGSVTYSGLAVDTYNLWVRWGNAQCPQDLGTVTLTDANGVPSAVMGPDRTVFVDDNTVFAVNATNADSFQWQVTTDGTTFTNISDGNQYSGTQTNQLIINSVPLNLSGNRYVAVVSQSATSCTPFTSDSALLTVNVRTVITNRRITHRVKKF